MTHVATFLQLFRSGDVNDVTVGRAHNIYYQMTL